MVSGGGSIKMVRYCCSLSWNSSTGRPFGSTAFAFAIAFIAVAFSSFMGLAPRALATGCYGSFMVIVGIKIRVQ